MTACRTGESQATVTLSVRVEQAKLFHTTVVLDSICVCGSHNRISAGERCLVHVRPSTRTVDVRRLCRDLGVPVEDSSGRWVEAKARQVLLIRTDAKRTIERNRKGVRVLECDEVVRIEDANGKVGTGRNDLFHRTVEDDMPHAVSDKGERHRIFAKWLVETYGIDALSSGSGVLDVAGGSGELSRALSEVYGVPSILLDPDPRCAADDTTWFRALPHALHGDGSQLTDRSDRVGDLVRRCSLVAGMHPDQATEPIVDMSLRLAVPFAVLPCCVMPTLFPFRRQKRHGDPVRSYSAFCQYLLDKAPEGIDFQMDYLPFVGRNRVIFWIAS